MKVIITDLRIMNNRCYLSIYLALIGAKSALLPKTVEFVDLDKARDSD